MEFIVASYVRLLRIYNTHTLVDHSHPKTWSVVRHLFTVRFHAYQLFYFQFIFTCPLFQHRAANTNTLSIATKEPETWAIYIRCLFLFTWLVVVDCMCVWVSLFMFTLYAVDDCGDRFTSCAYLKRLYICNFHSVIILHPKWYVVISTLLTTRANKVFFICKIHLRTVDF